MFGVKDGGGNGARDEAEYSEVDEYDSSRQNTTLVDSSSIKFYR